MKNFFYKQTFIIFIIIFFCLPLLQMIYNIFPSLKTSGVEVSQKKPTFTIANFLSGNFQEEYNSWFNQNVGFKEYFIRTNNQIYYSLFNDTPNNSTLLVGKNKNLFEKHYIKEYFNITPPIDIALLESKIKQIKELQLLLKKRGIAFLLVVTPSKASIYPEYISNVLNSQNEKPRNYNNLIPLLDKYKINYVDGHEITRLKRNQGQYPLFPEGGTHWNKLGALYTTQAIIDNLQEQLSQDLTKLSLEDVKIDNNPIGSDKDIAQLLNLWNTPDNFEAYHPIINATAGKHYKPRILIEGGSFDDLIIELLHEYKVTSSIDFYFYYKRLVTYEIGKERSDKGPVNSIDWETDVFNKDAIIVEMNEQNIPKILDGFIQDALNKLDIQEISFDYIDKNVSQIDIKGKIGYLLKKGAKNQTVFLSKSGLNLSQNTDYLLSYKAKGYNKLNVDLFPDNLPEYRNEDIGNDFKEFNVVFNSSSESMKDSKLRFFVDGINEMDKDIIIYDIKFEKVGK
ncbi:hypothetical protein [Paenibacillus sp. UMB4589-SE434]|uniref:alginate O-acetyltransferase AlgX-related protein n=1 Tax=Paenibacillus sp. UMB4589-SE434 TaxID=3046314 RepID=UPI00254F2B3A|nr:hypothetical protein [Paenibacillus sp. UMB4589-SE434]MDK8181682.1 hypothetical protein [Paenibacillus sp. UMB4589-SE434]